ncbi:MAG: helix-turn-helix domain-containing protein, partial [Paracoccus sp. (in: a-proteobacteria)]|nr:helix-turn-helix domain-containing protein [Paracoccus sp. (in: a-proteobacteria)]
LEKWLSVDGLAAMSKVTPRMVRKAFEKGRWRGADLMVRQVEIGRGGAGGMAPQVHVDSLPADLREAWYLSRGIALHKKVDPATGETILVPEDAAKNDPKWDERAAAARFRMDVIRHAVAQPKGSPARKAALDALAGRVLIMPDGKRRALSRSTLYNWVAAYDAGGLFGLMDAPRKDKGQKRAIVTLAWDQFFAGRIGGDDHARIGETLTTYIRSLWASGESGWRAIIEKSTTRLIEISRELRDVSFDALPIGRAESAASTGSQFGICCVNRRLAEAQREYAVIAIKNRDNARYQDTIAPTIRRDYSQLLPREIVVGDVHPTDIIVLRPDGSRAYPKAISWFDPSTNEIHMTVVLLEKGEGIRREHVAMSFEAMVADWGLPKLLYLDNGSEYSWAEMIDGFTRLSQAANVIVKEYGTGSLADQRVTDAREAVVRSLPYNAKGKPGIEGAFGNLEQVFFSNLMGWTAGDRMRKKTHAKGKDPIPFPGDMTAFLAQISTALEWYHKRPQYGRLNGRSPNEAL